MANKKNRYMIMERYMTFALLADALLFVAYLIVAGYGVTWAKILLSVLAILLSAAILGFLYLSKELLRQRSLWMTAAAAAVVLCTVFSLILNFPRPKYQLPDPTDPSAPVQITDSSAVPEVTTEITK